MVFLRNDTALASDMNFVMNHASGPGLISQPVYKQPSMLALYHGCPLHKKL